MTKDNATPPQPPTSKTTLAPTPKDTSIRIPRRVALGVGVGAAVLGLMAATAAVSFAVADQFDDDRASAVLTTPPGAGVAPGTPSPGQAPGPRSNDVTGTITEFIAARDAAVVAAGGGSAISLDRDQRGWEVEVFTTRGHVEVRLDESLTVIAIEEPDADDRNEPAPVTVLDGNLVNDAIAAAIAAAGSGAATDVDAADWDDRPGYTVTLVLADGTELDVYLDPSLTVTSTQIDD